MTFATCQAYQLNSCLLWSLPILQWFQAKVRYQAQVSQTCNLRIHQTGRNLWSSIAALVITASKIQVARTATEKDMKLTAGGICRYATNSKACLQGGCCTHRTLNPAMLYSKISEITWLSLKYIEYMHLSDPISTTALTLFRSYAFAFSHIYDSAQLSHFDGKRSTLSASAGALTPGLGVAGVAGVSGTADVSCIADVSGTVGVAVVGVSVMPLVARHKYVLWWFSDFQPFWPKQKKWFKSRHITKFQDSNDQCFFVFAYDILTWSSWVFNETLLIVFVSKILGSGISMSNSGSDAS